MKALLRRMEQPLLPILRLLGRIVVKLASYDVARLRMHTTCHRIHGPPERVILGGNVDLQTSYLNTVSGTITLGENSFCGQNCMFLTGTHDYRRKGLERQKHPNNGNDITIGKGVWICSGAIILGGLTIADHAVIAAGAVVTTDCPKAGIYGGVPARLIREIEFLVVDR